MPPPMANICYYSLKATSLWVTQAGNKVYFLAVGAVILHKMVTGVSNRVVVTARRAGTSLVQTDNRIGARAL